MVRSNTKDFDEKEIGINILIDSLEIDMPVLIDFARRVHFNYTFSLSEKILGNGDIKIILPQLYTLFVLSGYFRKNGNRIPVFLNTVNDLPESLGIVKDYFELQGERIVEFTIFQTSIGQQKIKNAVLFLEPAEFENFNESLLDESGNPEPQQVIVISTRYTGSVKDEIAYVNSIIEENYYLRKFLKLTALRLEICWLIHKSNLWKQRANLYYSFIDLSKKVGERQYYDILDWYKKEYEILPLWYKRVGHAIKFLSGKKKFNYSRK